MGWSSLFVFLCASWTFFSFGTHQLQSSQRQVLLQLRKRLEYPKQLEIWFNNSTTDLCYLSSPQVNITCQDNSITELRVVGDKPNKVRNFDGFSIPFQTLSENFSMDSFVVTLTRLNSLRVLSLRSLGIWGPLPNKVYRLYSLEYLDLGSNFLFGSVPPEISRLVKLQTLVLDINFFNGSIHDLSSLTSLHVLDLGENKLSSELPIMPKGLVMAFLNKNSFSSEIPRKYTLLAQLQHLDLSFNSLVGTPPAALFSLPNITYLNLASNMLSGSLPIHLSCGTNLGFVDISNNKLKDWLPSCLSNAIDKRVVMYGGNCLGIDLRDQHPSSYCEVVGKMKRQEKGRKNVGILAGVIGGILVIVLVLAFGFLVLCRLYCPRGTSEQHLLHKSVQDNSISGLSSEALTNARYIAQATKLGTHGVPVHQLFSLEELKEATNNFDISTLMGEGSNGKLYKGRLENGSQVAIRRLTVSRRYTIRNLKLRLDLLSRLRHQHLVCLLGHCIDVGVQNDSGANIVYLVYEYVPNGTYHAYLIGDNTEKVLKWSDRLAILIGIAKAVHFLHTGVIPGFLTNRLKAKNILLNDHWMAKLSDYGLSVIAEEIDKYEEKGDGLKSWQMKCLEDDVYSFGFILLESLVGSTLSARREAFLLNEMVSFGSQDGQKRIVDPIVLSTCSQESLSIVISIMNKCISTDSSTRPSFEDVLWNLQYAAQVQATSDGDPRI